MELECRTGGALDLDLRLSIGSMAPELEGEITGSPFTVFYRGAVVSCPWMPHDRAMAIIQAAAQSSSDFGHPQYAQARRASLHRFLQKRKERMKEHSLPPFQKK